jgi:5'(3')-deoxyribonucleotidase
MTTVARKRLAIDQDEVIADFLAKAIAYYNKEYQQIITSENLLDHLNANPTAGDILYGYMEYENFCGDLEVMKDSQNVMFELSKNYEIFIVSAATLRPKTIMDKLQWISKHFSFIPRENIVFCGDKSIVYADYLIDDSVDHVKRFRGTGILYTNPYNKEHTELPRVDNWNDIAKMFL